MRHLIVGCGRLGATLATALDDKAHGVTVVDRDPEALQRLGKTFRGHRIVGVAFDRNTLEDAGISDADGFATVTNSDNTNFVLATSVFPPYLQHVGRGAHRRITQLHASYCPTRHR